MKSKLVILFLFLAFIELSECFSGNWTQFKLTLKRNYSRNSTEEFTRKRIWERNFNRTLMHNKRAFKGEVSYTIGINKFSDMTYKEVIKFYTGAAFMTNVSSGCNKNLTNNSIKSFPATVDWRTIAGYVTPVKDQGDCGSCWAFSAVGTLEGQYFKKNGKQLALSEQNLVDCAASSYGNYGCDGGVPAYAFNYIRANKGINSESTYPYVGVQQSCYYSKSSIATSITKYGYDVKSYGTFAGNETYLQEMVATVGPVSACIYVSNNFLYYTGGVFDDASCLNQMANHCIVVVGYGNDPKYGDYWIVKNSWSAGWGESGYIRMKRNKKNQCMISSFVTYPII